MGGNIKMKMKDQCLPCLVNQVIKVADITAKGQANYECLSEYEKKKIYFLLMAKCQVIANDIGVATNSLVCLNGYL